MNQFGRDSGAEQERLVLGQKIVGRGGGCSCFVRLSCAIRFLCHRFFVARDRLFDSSRKQCGVSGVQPVGGGVLGRLKNLLIVFLSLVIFPKQQSAPGDGAVRQQYVRFEPFRFEEEGQCFCFALESQEALRLFHCHRGVFR